METCGYYAKRVDITTVIYCCVLFFLECKKMLKKMVTEVKINAKITNISYGT